MIPQLLSYGPVLAVINNTDFAGYKGGILKPPLLPIEYKSYQFIIIVGCYRGSPDPSDSKNQVTLKILNSWGTSWGESGFGYLSENWLGSGELLGPFITLIPGTTIGNHSYGK